MAEATSLTLATDESATSPSGVSAAVSITGRQRAAELALDVSAFTGSTLTVAIQRRDAVTDSWETTNTTTVTATGRTKLAAMVGPLTRLSYTLDGTATFSVAGTAETVYCSPDDLTDEIVKPEALSEIAETRLVRACLSASSNADGWLNSRYVLPLTAWGRDLRNHTAELAAANLFTWRGTDPDSPDSLIYDARNQAKYWFDRLQAGRIEPPEIADSTPEVYEAGVVVASNTRRGW